MRYIDFKQIAKTAIEAREIKIETRTCPDQFLGPIKDVLHNVDFPCRLPALLRTNAPCIIMVLESPHADEFIGEPAPAKGFTGEMIRRHLSEAISVDSLQSYDLILINAIQHQCSLGVSTDLYRDRIFRTTWNAGGRESFVSRIKHLYRPGDIVVNCCTKGNDYKTDTALRNLVEHELRKALPSVETIKRMHPAAWREPSRIGVEWQYTEPTKVELDPAVRRLVADATSSLPKINEHVEVNTLTQGGVSTPTKLLEVKENILVNGARCTVIVLSDGTRKHMKTATFDPKGLITKKAKDLVGLPVKATCWNPRKEPSKWSNQGYFNDIFSA